VVKLILSSSLKKDQLKVLNNLREIFGQSIPLEMDFPTNKKVYFVESEGDIVTLALNDLSLNYLPEEIVELKEIVVLNLANNNFKKVPDVIQKLTKLSILDLAFNQLDEIPKWIGELKNLRELRFNNNQLYSLPSSIGSLTILRRLFLQSNGIHSLPFELLELQLLEEIHLDFRSTIRKSLKMLLSNLESNGCVIRNNYNRR